MRVGGPPRYKKINFFVIPGAEVILAQPSWDFLIFSLKSILAGKEWGWLSSSSESEV